MTKLIDPFNYLKPKDYNYKYLDINLYQAIKEYDFNSKNTNNIIKTQSRSSTIKPMFQGSIVAVYNGKKYIPFKITKDYIGHKFGEFIYTRRNVVHKKQGKKLIVKKKQVVSKVVSKSQFKLSQISSLYLKKKYLLNEKKS